MQSGSVLDRDLPFCFTGLELINQFNFVERRRLIIKQSTATMPKVVSALTARTQFGQILKRATQRNERFLVGRRGEPQVVIMSIQDYIKTMAPPPQWLETFWVESKRKGTDKLTMGEINREIAVVRRQQRRKAIKKQKQ